MSTCVRWFTLEFPSVKSLKKVKVFAANPVFFSKKHEVLPNRYFTMAVQISAMIIGYFLLNILEVPTLSLLCSACQRSVMLECSLSLQDLNKLNPVALDDTIDIKLVCPGIMVAIFKVLTQNSLVQFCHPILASTDNDITLCNKLMYFVFVE